MEKTFNYRFSRRTLYTTAAYLLLYFVLGIALYHLCEGGYLSAWFTSFVAALIALMALSIPRRIVVTDECVEVRCLCDITELRRADIAAIRRVEPREMKRMLPLFGGWGFFGYYGHYLDLRDFDHVRIYATERDNLIEITDIFEERLYVSCSDPERLMAELLDGRPHTAAQHGMPVTASDAVSDVEPDVARDTVSDVAPDTASDAARDNVPDTVPAPPAGDRA